MYKHLNVVSDHPHIPEEAFLFRPYRSADLKVKDDFRIGEGKGIRRLMFEGWADQTITPYEVEKLQEFDDYVQRKGIKLDERWDKSWRLRFLLSTGCNIKKTLADMEIFLAYQNRVRDLPFSKVVSKYLVNRGVCRKKECFTSQVGTATTDPS